MLHTKLRCGNCGTSLILDDDLYICPECGMEVDAPPIRYDEYWTCEDEKQATEELDDYFYKKYPGFRKQ